MCSKQKSFCGHNLPACRQAGIRSATPANFIAGHLGLREVYRFQNGQRLKARVAALHHNNQRCCQIRAFFAGFGLLYDNDFITLINN